MTDSNLAFDADEIRSAERWLRAFTFWLRNPQPHNAEAARDRGLAVQAALRPKLIFMGVEAEGFNAFTADMVELISRNDFATALEMARLSGALGEREPALLEACEALSRALMNHFESVIQETFQVTLGYIGTTDDHSVQVTNEEVDVNIVREDNKWWIKIFGASGEFIKPFDFRHAMKLIINVRKVTK